MTEEIDRRSRQRFANYQKALIQLQEFIAKEKLNKFEEQGFIQVFEYTFELAWKTLQDVLMEQGNQNLYGVRSVIEEAFKVNLLADGGRWLAMLKSRNASTHTYNEEVVASLVQEIPAYMSLFVDLREQLQSYYER